MSMTAVEAWKVLTQKYKVLHHVARADQPSREERQALSILVGAIEVILAQKQAAEDAAAAKPADVGRSSHAEQGCRHQCLAEKRRASCSASNQPARLALVVASRTRTTTSGRRDRISPRRFFFYACLSAGR